MSNKRSKIKISRGSMPPDPPSLPHALHMDTYCPPPLPINPYDVILSPSLLGKKLKETLSRFLSTIMRMAGTSNKHYRSLGLIRSAFTDGLLVRKGNKGAKQIDNGRTLFRPDVEARLSKSSRNVEPKVKHWWFRTCATQLMCELHPEADLKFSAGWFD